MSLRPITLLGIIVSMVTGVALGILLATPDRKNMRAIDVDTFAQVFDHVARYYVDDVPREQLVDDALRGMLDGLDPHSAYLDADVYDALQTDTTGEFGGIGIELGLVEGYFVVIAPIDGTPAEQAGLRAGDRIIRVQGKSLAGMKLREVIDRLRGSAGSRVHLVFLRNGDRLERTITRSNIQIASVHHRMLPDGIGYVRISQFHRSTARDFADALNALRTSSGSPLRGLVLDLRNNPGGLLGASVDVVDAFVDSGLIVYTEGRDSGSRRTFSATAETRAADLATIVLINEGSASAAEIVAGALRDHERAILMGSKTYGKGSVQSVLTLPHKRGVKLTTARYFTPDGHAIHGAGIVPDIEWSGDADSLIDAAAERLRSAPEGSSLTSLHTQTR